MEMEQLDLLSLQLWHDDDNFSLRATVQVARLPKDARVEIDLIASYD